MMARAAIPPASIARLIAGQVRAKTGLLTLADGIADSALFRPGISWRRGL
jgi:hypothetical protein